MPMIDINLLRPNPISTRIYGDILGDEDFNTLKTNIADVGIHTALLITSNYFIISGVRRYLAAKQLGIAEVPVKFSKIQEADVDEFLVISVNTQRAKTEVRILYEIELINEHYRLKSGRNPNDPEVIEGKAIRKCLEKSMKRPTRDRWREAKNNLVKLHGNEVVAWEKLLEMERNNVSATAAQQQTKELLQQKSNEEALRTVIIPHDDTRYQIFLQDAQDMSAVQDNTVDCIFTSPPYFNQRDYLTGNKQIGMEDSVEEYIENLMIVLRKCHRKLKDTGSLWVNVMDVFRENRQLNIDGILKYKLIKEGWLYISDIIWVKDNPIFQDSKRFQPCYEHIIHLAKTPRYQFYKDWMTVAELEGKVTYGDNGTHKQVRDFFDYRSNVLETTVVNNRGLANFLAQNGFQLNHHAIFPIEVPSLGVLACTNPGDIVLDVFSGLGTTGIAALGHNRKYIGLENSEIFKAMSELRINAFLNDLDNGVHLRDLSTEHWGHSIAA